MSIATRRLGLADHGKRLPVREFESAKYEDGYKYELIEGRLYVSPQAQEPENRLELWLFGKLWDFADGHPEIINHGGTYKTTHLPGFSLRIDPRR